MAYLDSFLFGVPKPWPMWVSFIKVWVEHVWLQGKKDPLEYPPENKKSWAQACLCSDDEDKLYWKNKKWGYSRIQVPENGPVRHLYPRWCQGPLAWRHSRICTLGLPHECGGSFLLCLFLSVYLCLVEKSSPGEAGIGPDHHVMPGTDIGLGQPADWLLWGWDPFRVQWVVIGEGEGRRKQAPRAQNVVFHASRSCRWVGLRNTPGTVC